MREGLGKFTCDLYQKLEKKSNIFFSGYSISSAMALAYLGALGETKQQMAEVMGYTPEAPEVVKALMDLGTALNTSDGKIQTMVGNAVWVQRDLELTQQFLKAAHDVSELIRKVDYKNAPEAARKEINGWVAEKTRDMITDLIPEGTFDSLTRLVLTNAIYFNGKWGSEFDPELTREYDFYNLDGTKSTVELMFKRETYCRYHEDHLYQMVALPYADKHGRDAEMLVILPKPDCFDAVDQMVTYPKLKRMAEISTVETKVKLWLPKFKLKYKNDIASLLAEDMPLAFSDSADFSGITGKRDLTISNVIHEAVVDVTEEGTEAAAATAVVMKLCCAAPNMDPVVRVDRPFIFAVWDVKNEVPMFMGRTAKL
jgi:serpin B